MTAAEHIECSTGRTELASHAQYNHDIRNARFPDRLVVVVHWVARLIVTEFGILAGIVACGVCFVTAVIMDRHGL